MRTAKLIIAISVLVFRICNAYGDSDDSKYEACFNTASQYYQIPKEILKAIAFVESHYNPNAYNENVNGTYDIGLMQINSSWLPQLVALGITEHMLYEPCQSIYMGAWILANNVKLYGLTWTAVQRYNGKDIDLKYATKIYNHIQDTYPSLLSPSQAKLIPINTQLSQVKNKNISDKTLPVVTNEDTKAKHIDPKAESVKTQQEYVNEVNDILYKSGVKSLSGILQNKKIDINSNGISTAHNNMKTMSFNELYFANQPKDINAIVNMIINSHPVDKLIIDYDDLCNMNGFLFCILHDMTLDFILQNSGISLESQSTILKKPYSKNHNHRKTVTMLVI